MLTMIQELNTSVREEHLLQLIDPCKR